MSFDDKICNDKDFVIKTFLWWKNYLSWQKMCKMKDERWTKNVWWKFFSDEKKMLMTKIQIKIYKLSEDKKIVMTKY